MIIATGQLPCDGPEKLRSAYDVIEVSGHSDYEKLGEDASQIRAAVSVAPFDFPRALFDRLPALEFIAHWGVGYDSINNEVRKSRSVKLTNTPDVLSDAVAEMAVTHLLCLSRDIHAANRYVRDGNWRSANSFPLSRGLKNRNIGIMGLGRIGFEIARRLIPFKSTIRYWQRTQRSDVPFDFEPNLRKLASWSDYLIISVPGGKSTNKIVDEQVINAVGPNGGIVNVSRGSVIDEKALISALDSGQLGCAGLDVFDNEPNINPWFLSSELVSLSPHVGSGTQETFQAMSDTVIANMAAFFQGSPLLTPVDD